MSTPIGFQVDFAHINETMRPVSLAALSHFSTSFAYSKEPQLPQMVNLVQAVNSAPHIQTLTATPCQGWFVYYLNQVQAGATPH